MLTEGSDNSVGGVTNVAIPAAGETNTTGAVTGWVTSTADKIKFTVTDSAPAVSTITISGVAYTSGADYTIPSTSTLTIVVTTTETGKSNTVRTFMVTVAAAAVINIDVITGVTAPVTGGAPVATITETAQYTGVVTWAPTGTFAGSTIYTAWITLTPKAGFTLTGVTANFFTVAEATPVTNMINSGIVTAVFPATLAVAIGDDCGGGIVAYILESGDPGYNASVQHGLIAAEADQSLGIRWYNGSNITTGATGTALGTGSANTTTIITIQGAIAINYAAGLARDYRGGEHDDWFLPSQDELNKLWENLADTPEKRTTNGFVGSHYWSSSEYDADEAWMQYFLWADGCLRNSKSANTYRVRAVRAF